MTAGDCKHYTGALNERCDAGVRYADLVAPGTYGFALILPCLPSLRAGQRAALARAPALPVVTCGKFTALTAEEVKAHEAEAKAHVRRLFAAVEAGVSPCCGAALDESQVITTGSHAGHGPRFCPACRRVVFQA